MGCEKVVEELVEKLVKKLPGVPKEEIEKRAKLLICEFKVPPSEAAWSIINYARREFKLEAPRVKIAELQPGTTATVKAKVIRLFESRNPKVKYVGIAGDETGTVRFVVFNEDIEVEEGKVYEFRNVGVDEFRDRLTITVTSLGSVAELDEDIEVKAREEVTFEGAVVAVQRNSGLVQRCKKCGRIANRGLCVAHGKVETEEALRAKLIVDDGETAVQAVLSGEVLEKLTGLTFDEAVRIKNELGREATYDEIAKRLVGRYVRLQGTRGSYYLITSQAEVIA